MKTNHGEMDMDKTKTNRTETVETKYVTDSTKENAVLVSGANLSTNVVCARNSDTGLIIAEGHNSLMTERSETMKMGKEKAEIITTRSLGRNNLNDCKKNFGM